MKKCEDLKGRSRLNNMRVIVIPKGSEGTRPTDYLAAFSQKLLGLEQKLTLNRAHRTLSPRPADGEPPRPFVVRVNTFQQRNEIWRRAGTSPLLHNGKRISVFPDCTTAVAEKKTSTLYLSQARAALLPGC